jgi:hypothetical protein
MNKDLAAQFLSAIITRNSGQRIEDDVKEALAYAEVFERLTADYTTPQAALELVQNPKFEPAKEKWILRIDGTIGKYFSQEYRNRAIKTILNQAWFKGKVFLVIVDGYLPSGWDNVEQILEYYSEFQEVELHTFRDENATRKYLEKFYEERGGFSAYYAKISKKGLETT